MSQTFEVSTRVMKAMNNMVNMRTITETMRGLEKEMMTVMLSPHVNTIQLS